MLKLTQLAQVDTSYYCSWEELSEDNKVRIKILKKSYELLMSKQKEAFDKIESIVNEKAKASSKKVSDALHEFASSFRESFDICKESFRRHYAAVFLFLQYNKKIDWDYVRRQDKSIKLEGASIDISLIDRDFIDSLSEILEQLNIDTFNIMSNFDLMMKHRMLKD